MSNFIGIKTNTKCPISLKDVLRLSRVTRPYRKPRHMKKDTYICKCLFLYQQLPILPGRFRPSTFGVCELNFRVRHGYG